MTPGVERAGARVAAEAVTRCMQPTTVVDAGPVVITHAGRVLPTPAAATPVAAQGPAAADRHAVTVTMDVVTTARLVATAAARAAVMSWSVAAATVVTVKVVTL